MIWESLFCSEVSIERHLVIKSTSTWYIALSSRNFDLLFYQIIWRARLTATGWFLPLSRNGTSRSDWSQKRLQVEARVSDRSKFSLFISNSSDLYVNYPCFSRYRVGKSILLNLSITGCYFIGFWNRQTKTYLARGHFSQRFSTLLFNVVKNNTVVGE